MWTELFLALRNLKPRNNAVSVITLLCILGVTIGVLVLVVVMAVMTGFSDMMKSKLIETQAHFQIRGESGTIPPRSDNVYSRNGMDFSVEKAMEAVAAAGGEAAPAIQGAVLVQYGPDKRHLDTQAVVMALPPEMVARKFDIKSYLKSGEFTPRRVGRTSYAVISEDMARRWQLEVGGTFLAHSARRLTSLVKFNAEGGIELDQDSSAYLPVQFTVAGIYSAGKSDFDKIIFFADPDDAAELFDLPWGAATSIFGWGKDPFDQEKLLAKLQQELPEFRVISWEEQNRKLLEVLQVEKVMMFFLLIFIVLVAAFSITNTLITSVIQKTREIGLLKALGFSDGKVMRIFVWQGFLVGFFGSIAGTVLGVLVIRYRNNILRFTSEAVGIELFPKNFYFFNELPAHIVPADVVVIVLASIVLCTLGALIPAHRAAKLPAAEALRYE